jgi:hypothetical protein
MGTPVGAFATRELNLKEINYKGKSDGFATRLYAVGKDGLTFASINSGKAYVDNNAYSSRVICAYWQDDRYTDKASLLADAQTRLAKMAVPERSYDCAIVDLQATNPSIYNNLDFSLFTTATLIDDIRGTSIDYLVVERHVWPYHPDRNDVIFNSSPVKIQNSVVQIEDEITNPNSTFQQIQAQRIQEATDWLTNGDGYVVAVQDSDGNWTETLYMDTNDISTAQQVLRINKNGIGFSRTGVNGPYYSAWTLDGKFNADWILTGTLLADLIKTGLLSDYNGVNYWNMTTGDLRMTSGAKIKNVNADYSGAYVPTSGNSPASSWETDAQKDQHVGQTFRDTSTDISYRWTRDSSQDVVYTRITFDAQSEVEATYDYLKFYYEDAYGTWWECSTVLTGAFGAASVVVPSATVYIKWHSDYAQTAWGWAIASIDQVTSMSESYSVSSNPGTPTDVIDGVENPPQTDHPYTDNVDKLYKINTGFINTVYTYSWVSIGATLADYVSGAVGTLDDELDQEGVFNRLTDNGALQGIYMQDGRLFINAEYIKAGFLNADRIRGGTITGVYIDGVTINSDYEIGGIVYGRLRSENGALHIYGLINGSLEEIITGQAAGLSILSKTISGSNRYGIRFTPDDNYRVKLEATGDGNNYGKILITAETYVHPTGKPDPVQTYTGGVTVGSKTLYFDKGLLYSVDNS